MVDKAPKHVPPVDAGAIELGNDPLYLARQAPGALCLGDGRGLTDSGFPIRPRRFLSALIVPGRRVQNLAARAGIAARGWDVTAGAFGLAGSPVVRARVRAVSSEAPVAVSEQAD